MPLTAKEKFSLFSWYHSFIKWLLHLITGRCELERICSNIKCPVTCNLDIEKSLRNSKSESLNRVLTTAKLDVHLSVQQVMQEKKLKAEESLVFIERFSKSLIQICGYIDLMDIVEQQKKMAFSSENRHHEEKLLQLWELLMPDTKLENRISSQWSDIGFQGKNPQTDFRGMGMLGLENLLYFAKNQNEMSRKVLYESHHPTYWYSYAIVGINISDLLYRFLNSGVLKTHFYNIIKEKPTMEDFHNVYCYLFREFSSFWLAQKPASVMEFNSVRDKFREHIVSILQNPKATLAVEVSRVCGDVDYTSVRSLSSAELD